MKKYNKITLRKELRAIIEETSLSLNERKNRLRYLRSYLAEINTSASVAEIIKEINGLSSKADWEDDKINTHVMNELIKGIAE